MPKVEREEGDASLGHVDIDVPDELPVFDVKTRYTYYLEYASQLEKSLGIKMGGNALFMVYSASPKPTSLVKLVTKLGTDLTDDSLANFATKTLRIKEAAFLYAFVYAYASKVISSPNERAIVPYYLRTNSHVELFDAINNLKSLSKEARLEARKELERLADKNSSDKEYLSAMLGFTYAMRRYLGETNPKLFKALRDGSTTQS